MTSKKQEDDVSDDELLAEIAKDAEVLNDTVNASNNEGSINLNINDTMNGVNIDNAENAEYRGGAQLTTFQDNIITTGSDVSILLMVILMILFVVQMIRKTYNYFTFESKIQSVVNPLDDARPMAAENLTPINPGYNHKSYAVYNTEFIERKHYLQKQSEGAQPSILKDILLCRAVKCIGRARALQRDGVGIRKNWNMDLLPRDVWEDFNAAQRNVQAEVECVVHENKRLQFQWGASHKNNIFSKAKEIHERNVMLQNKAFHHKMQNQSKVSKAPNPKTFGNGFNPGFFNKQNNNKRLTKKEKQELKRQKKAMKMKNTGQPTMLQDNIENPANTATHYQQTTARRRKPKRRFTTK